MVKLPPKTWSVNLAQLINIHNLDKSPGQVLVGPIFLLALFAVWYIRVHSALKKQYLLPDCNRWLLVTEYVGKPMGCMNKN